MIDGLNFLILFCIVVKVMGVVGLVLVDGCVFFEIYSLGFLNFLNFLSIMINGKIV